MRPFLDSLASSSISLRAFSLSSPVVGSSYMGTQMLSNLRSVCKPAEDVQAVHGPGYVYTS